jgi:hypothetical protein
MAAHDHSNNSSTLKLVDREQPRLPGILQTARYIISKLGSCWHGQMSRPFTHRGQTYCVCLRCGMYRNFDLDTWRMTGQFYRPTPELRAENGGNAKPIDRTHTPHLRIVNTRKAG